MNIAELVFVDGQYLRPNYVCITLIIKNNAVTIIDTGSKDSIEPIYAALRERALDWSDVEFIIPTHAHLDHAGGAGYLMQYCDNATLITHEKAARHLIDPSRLKESTISIYGQQEFENLYGDIIPIDASRIRIVVDNEVIEFQGDHLIAIDAPGHCYHQIALYHQELEIIICGDAFGMSFPTLAGRGGNFNFPTTSPTQFNPEVMRETYKKILAFNPKSIQIAHYGVIDDAHRAHDEMNRILDDYLQLSKNAFEREIDSEEFADELMDYHSAYLKEAHGEFSDDFIFQELKPSISINAAGLLHYQMRMHQ